MDTPRALKDVFTFESIGGDEKRVGRRRGSDDDSGGSTDGSAPAVIDVGSTAGENTSTAAKNGKDWAEHAGVLDGVFDDVTPAPSPPTQIRQRRRRLMPPPSDEARGDCADDGRSMGSSRHELLECASLWSEILTGTSASTSCVEPLNDDSLFSRASPDEASDADSFRALKKQVSQMFAKLDEEDAVPRRAARQRVASRMDAERERQMQRHEQLLRQRQRFRRRSETSEIECSETSASASGGDVVVGRSDADALEAIRYKEERDEAMEMMRSLKAAVDDLRAELQETKLLQKDAVDVDRLKTIDKRLRFAQNQARAASLRNKNGWLAENIKAKEERIKALEEEMHRLELAFV